MKTVSIANHESQYLEILLWLFKNKVPHVLNGEQYIKNGYYPKSITMSDSDAVMFILRFGL